MLRGLGVVAYQQLFVKLFTGAQAGDGDLYVTFRLVCGFEPQARHLHHAAGQVMNAHRLAHVKHKNIAASAHGAGLDHQLRRFRDAHEKAGDVGVRERDGPAVFDLLAKQRHHRTAGTQHITKAHHRKAGTRPGGASAVCIDSRVQLSQRLQNHFCQALGGAHDVGGPHGLVGADQNKVLHPVARSRLGTHQRAPHVVAQALCRVVLYQGHVLVSGRMVQRVRLPGVHDLVHTHLVTHRRQQGHNFDGLLFCGFCCRLGQQLLVYLVKRDLAHFYQQQLFGIVFQNLAAQLTANAATRPGDQHCLVKAVSVDQQTVGLDALAAQQIV